MINFQHERIHYLRWLQEDFFPILFFSARSKKNLLLLKTKAELNCDSIMTQLWLNFQHERIHNDSTPRRFFSSLFYFLAQGQKNTKNSLLLLKTKAEEHPIKLDETQTVNFEDATVGAASFTPPWNLNLRNGLPQKNEPCSILKALDMGISKMTWGLL